ncbi:MAG: AAA family ATPase, partial [Planctomycetota bacterium]|nr:AAA family ATPase [Planctomycetota bacterium]
MNITVPIYVEQKHLDGEQTQFRLRPLFFSSPEASDARLNRATSKLALELRKELGRLGKSMRHEELAAFNYCPSFQQFNVQCLVHLKQGSLSVQQLAVSFEHLDRRIAFFPALPDLWFEVQRGQDVQSRASQAMTEYCQAELRRDAESFESLKRLTNKEHCWITTIEIDLQPKQKIPEKSEVRLASLFASQPMDGESELDRVGRCLNWLYPDDLDRIICRESELEELNRILTSTDNRPVLIVGERQVGKTALIHEFVYQQVMKRKKVYQSRKNVWLLSPQRLVSGMVYVGQWEERLHAILKVAAKKNLTLYFDDLLGLFLAGISANNKLSMAEVLRPILEQRKVRVLGEITPEAFRVLQERDRGFADMFHILPLSQPDDGANLRIVIETARQLESHHRCRFALEVIPAVLDLQRRYVREAAFPGKAATFMRQLAIKYQKKEITRETVLKEFHQKSGMDINFLDTNSRLKHEEIVQALSSGVIGQDGAVETAASVVTIAKARLNDTGRPLAALLFVGPTGVGKTQCAKTLAAYLFGDEERLVRFDMNEFVSQHAVNRLVGTFNQPDGLLTTAIRQQPFSVVLLDEIEKADPSVFDLLLQVMGEGRLTDAHGRTVDFSNAIIILTSNLGVKDAMNRMGFLDEESDEQSIYTDASEKFFRPEFVNRLDRIVPFSRLKHDDVLQISRLLIEKVFHREGLIRRKCVLDIHDEALERVVSKGFHPQLGARAV